MSSAPRKPNRTPESKPFAITDHNGDEVSIVWHKDDRRFHEELPPFPFQVYLLSSAHQVAEDDNLSSNLAAFLKQVGPVHKQIRCHFQIYRRTFPNILACIAHQKQEILHRNRNDIVPRMLASWTPNDNGDKGRLMVIDRNKWADGDFILVSYDPAEYDNPARFHEWNIAYEGDIDIVHARRSRSAAKLIETLHDWWAGAGQQWAENELELRNNGAASPALYPALDPAAHYDAEHEEIPELDGTAIGGPTVPASEEDSDEYPRIVDTFDPFDLYLKEHELREYLSETYSDILGHPVTSVWNGELSRVRPHFSFTLYIGFDFFDKIQVHTQALFRCLNKGLIARERWTLDIVNNMPSLDAAFRYHARATAQRTPERCEQRRACIRLAVRKIAGSKLPSEILEYIEDLLLPPEIPRYHSLPFRPFKDVFLYLDKSHQYTGPLLIYSHNNTRQSNSHTTPFSNRSTPRHPWRGPDFDTESVLRVVYQRYWHRVADELHVLWSLCSPRCAETANLKIPRAELQLTAPEACVWRSQFGMQYINGYADVKILVWSDREIVIPRHHGLFSRDLWNECVDTVDLGTGDILAPLPADSQGGPICLNSWAQTRELGFKVGFETEYGQNPDENFEYVKVNETYTLGLRPTAAWWQHRVRHGTLKSGRQYAFRLKPGICIPRWTFGRNREGPFNLLPIPITVDETLHPFHFRCESVGAPHGSFTR